MKNYSTTLETIIAVIILLVVAFFFGRVKYYQHLEEKPQAETSQEK